MTFMRVLGRAAFIVALVPAIAAAQDASGASIPCRTDICAITFDWGSGTSAASLPVDRRYGAPIEFETTFKSVMNERGLRFSDRGGDAKLNVIFRLAMMNAICDFMPGTNTDRSCKTIKDVGVTFTNNDPTMKKKLNSMRFQNRCGAGDQVMTTVQFGRYVADLLQYALEGEEQKMSRPIGKC